MPSDLHSRAGDRQDRSSHEAWIVEQLGRARPCGDARPSSMQTGARPIQLAMTATAKVPSRKTPNAWVKRPRTRKRYLMSLPLRRDRIAMRLRPAV